MTETEQPEQKQEDRPEIQYWKIKCDNCGLYFDLYVVGCIHLLESFFGTNGFSVCDECSKNQKKE